MEDAGVLNWGMSAERLPERGEKFLATEIEISYLRVLYLLFFDKRIWNLC